MPKIATLGGVVIMIFGREHGRPHFHAKYAEHTAAIAIDDSLEVLAGWLPRAQLRVALQWAPGHLDELQAKWEELNGENATE